MKPAKILIHAGTHKTGTTTIQTLLSLNRERLEASGIWYPPIWEYFPVNPKGNSAVAQFAFPEAVANFGNQDRERIGDFTAAVRGRSEGLTLISAESIYRCTAPSLLAVASESDYACRARFVDRFAAVLAGFDVEVLLYFRRLDNFAGSLYSENMVRGASTISFQEFLETRTFRFDYRWQIDLISSYFPVKLRNFEKAAASNLVTSFCQDARIGAIMPQSEAKMRGSVPNAAALWMRRAKIENVLMAKQRRRRWHFALLKENANLFDASQKTSFWTSREERDAFIDRYQSGVTEIEFPPTDPDVAPRCEWTERQHREAERAFGRWEEVNRSVLLARESDHIAPFN